jgi:hypothetical protein
MMNQFYLLLLILVGRSVTSQAQANWYTPEVHKLLGYETVSDTPATPPFQTTEYKLKNCRIVSGTVAVFDTIATYAQGRIVDAITHKPIKAALIQASYSCFGQESLCGIKTAITDSAGFFRLGWVGCAGPNSGHSNRPLKINAVGYPTISTTQVSFGGVAYLHIELAAVARK